MQLSSNFSPSAQISALSVERGGIYVVRDDVLEGGTKQRAAVPYLADCMEQGYRSFVYASPFSGFAQLALAVSARRLGAQAVIFAERDPGRAGIQAHEFSRLAAEQGALLYLCESLGEAEDEARRFAERDRFTLKIPLGFNTPVFCQHLRAAVAQQVEPLLAKMPKTPKNFWLPVGSGTLARLFRQVLPLTVRMNCVDVRVLPGEDERIRSVQALPNSAYFRAPELFCEPVEKSAPIPSNTYYDAKLWRFIFAEAAHGDVWWNVAR